MAIDGMAMKQAALKASMRRRDSRLEEVFAVQQRSADWSSEVVEIHDVPPMLSQYVIQGLKPGHIYIFQARAVKFGRITVVVFSHRTGGLHTFL